jgi:hypothetical protein
LNASLLACLGPVAACPIAVAGGRTWRPMAMGALVAGRQGAGGGPHPGQEVWEMGLCRIDERGSR